uniref:Uncharacterized protein n=1 Tax=Vespula pensylvanica TaxID=30213 RepID=A0A834NRB3_VESPE|nr:hypothetical protein H0235_011121 [Vespula pensylvanica]
MNDDGTDARHLWRVLRNLCGRLAVGQHSQRIKIPRRTCRVGKTRDRRGVRREEDEKDEEEVVMEKEEEDEKKKKRVKGRRRAAKRVDFTLKQTAQRKLRSIHSTRSFQRRNIVCEVRDRSEENEMEY